MSDRPSRSTPPGLSSRALPKAVTIGKAPTAPREKPPTPLKGNEVRPTTGKPAGNALTAAPLDINKWDRDPVEIYQLLTGKEIPVDEYSGLVQPQR